MENVCLVSRRTLQRSKQQPPLSLRLSSPRPPAPPPPPRLLSLPSLRLLPSKTTLQRQLTYHHVRCRCSLDADMQVAPVASITFRILSDPPPPTYSPPDPAPSARNTRCCPPHACHLSPSLLRVLPGRFCSHLQALAVAPPSIPTHSCCPSTFPSPPSTRPPQLLTALRAGSRSSARCGPTSS